MDRYIAVDNVCGWPKLTRLDDGRINMNIHDKPSHGSFDGSAICYQSTDDGFSFQHCGISAQGGEEAGAFIDKACGVAHNGDYLVIVQNSKQATCYVLRSSDGGATYTQTGVIDSGREQFSNHGSMPFPYGDILRLGENTLAFNYWMNTARDWHKGYADGVHEAHLCISHDDGKTWTEDHLIAEGINETAVLFYDDLHGIAIGRIDAAFTANAGGQVNSGGGNMIYATEDGGKSWICQGHLLGQGIIPVHLTLLQDGRTLLTAGLRYANMGGVIVMLSSDRGKTWNEPNFIAQYPGLDGGYPSTVQLADGRLVTAYYSQGNMYHTRYHVGVVRWQISDLLEGKHANFKGPYKAFIGTGEECIQTWRVNC